MNLSNVKEVSSSCQCTMTFFGEHKVMKKIVWHGTRVKKPNVEWNRIAEVMMLNIAESGHPVFRAISALR